MTNEWICIPYGVVPIYKQISLFRHCGTNYHEERLRKLYIQISTKMRPRRLTRLTSRHLMQSQRTWLQYIFQHRILSLWPSCHCGPWMRLQHHTDNGVHTTDKCIITLPTMLGSSHHNLIHKVRVSLSSKNLAQLRR